MIRTRELSLQTSRHWGIKRNHAKDARWRGSVLHVADVVETGVVADYQGPAPTIKHVSTIQSLETGLMPGSKSKQKTRMEKSKVHSDSERPTLAEDWRTVAPAADMHHRAASEGAVETHV